MSRIPPALRFRLVDVFASEPLTGNPLAVYPEAVDLEPELMHRLTRELGLTESILVIGDTASRQRRVRIFTDREELPFAGHPLLGAAAVLHEESQAPEPRVEWSFELGGRNLLVVSEREGNHYRASFDQGRASFGRPLEPGDAGLVLAALGLAEADRAAGLPVQVASTGLPYLIVPLAQGLERARPDGPRLAPLLAAAGARFVYVLDAASREGRSWDHVTGLEDPATGSAVGPAALYLVRHGVARPREKLLFRQGRRTGRPSELEAECYGSPEGWVGVRIAGNVWTIAAGLLNPDLFALRALTAPADTAPAPEAVPVPEAKPVQEAVLVPEAKPIAEPVRVAEPPRVEPVIRAPLPVPVPLPLVEERPLPSLPATPLALHPEIEQLEPDEDELEEELEEELEDEADAYEDELDDELGSRPRALLQAIPQHPVATTEENFERFGLSQPILAVLRKIGFHHPTPIQAAVIPPALEGKDIIGLAQTGSGKTAAFCLPLAERLTHGRGVRGLILSPTREIALQTKAFLQLFGEDHHLKTVCLIGGVRMGPQIDGLRANPDIVVATPGRLLDHLDRGNLHLSKLSHLVLDEADHMLDLGFLPQIQDVLSYVPGQRQTLMFSATMPDAIERLAQRLMHEPERIDILPPGRAAEGITHRLYLVEPDDKKACLVELLNEELGSTLVFCRRKIDAEWLSRALEREGHPVVRIHSDRSQAERVQALEGFREGEHRILVATDIAARGIDIPRIQHIINFELPETVEDYIHRAGRTARGRLQGTVSSIATWQDKMMIKEIESALGFDLPRCSVGGVEPWQEMAGQRVRGAGRRHLPTRRRL